MKTISTHEKIFLCKLHLSSILPIHCQNVRKYFTGREDCLFWEVSSCLRKASFFISRYWNTARKNCFSLPFGWTPDTISGIVFFFRGNRWTLMLSQFLILNRFYPQGALRMSTKEPNSNNNLKNLSYFVASA